MSEFFRKGLPSGSPGALGFAVICVAAATAIRFLVGLRWPDAVFFATYFPATLVATLVGGWLAGALAATLGGILGWWAFMSPQFSFSFISTTQVTNLLLYGIAAAAVIAAAEHHRALMRRVRAHERELDLITGELDHRMRNSLTVVQAMVSQLLRGDPQTTERINSRIRSLVRTNDIITHSQSGRVARLMEILKAELEPYNGRITLSGPDLALESACAVPLAMVFHELAINAVKHGSLSAAPGSVDVTWTIAEDRLELDWVEKGGPPVEQPERRGFGANLLSRALVHYEGGVVSTYDPAGLRCRIFLPLPDCRIPHVPEIPRRFSNIPASG